MDYRSESLINDYLDVVNNVIDKKRDEELSKIIFAKEGINVKKVVEIVDEYATCKKNFEKSFRESVTVKVKWLKLSDIF